MLLTLLALRCHKAKLSYLFQPLLGAVLVLIQIPGLVRAAPSSNGSMFAKIDGLCERAREFGKKHEKSKRIFADVSEGERPRQNEGTWREFSSMVDLQKISSADGGVPNTQARVWKTKEGVTFVEAFFQSDSGDWGEVVDYCYRPDESLARIEVTSNNFAAGGIRSLEIRYFDNTGKAMKTQRQVFDMETGKSISLQKFLAPSTPSYANVKALPFFMLMKAH